MSTKDVPEFRGAPKLSGNGVICYTLRKEKGNFIFNVYNEDATGSNSSGDIFLGNISKLFSDKGMNRANSLKSSFFSDLFDNDNNDIAFFAAVLRHVGLIKKHSSGRYLHTLAVELDDFEDHIEKFFVEPFEKYDAYSELYAMLNSDK